MRLRKLLVLFAVLAMIAAACGGDDAGDDTTTTTAAATTTTAADTTTTAPPEDTTTTTADPTADWPDKVIFGFVPSQDIEELRDDVDTFAAVLSDALGIQVEGVVTTDYPALGVALGTGQADLGAFGPAGYVVASQAYDNLELMAQAIRFGDSTYHGQYFTNDPSICTGDPVEGAFYYDADGNVVALGPNDTPAVQVGWSSSDRSRDDRFSAGLICPEPVALDVIKGKTFAFTSESSTSGYIFPVLEFRANGIEDDDYTRLFAGNHDTAVIAVYDGNADFGVSFDDARRQVDEEKPDVGEKVITFNITDRIFNDVIAARAELFLSLKAAFVREIISYINTDEGNAVMDEIFGWTGLVPADETVEKSLEPVAVAIQELGFSD